MSRPWLAASLLAALLAAPTARAAGLEAGEWEQVMTITAPQVHGGQPMTQTMRQCITSHDAEVFADPDRWAQEMATAGSDAKCKVKETKKDGATMSIVLSCENDVELRARHTFEGKTGTVDAETFVGGVSQGKNHIESRKVADTCSPAAIEQWKRQNPGKTFAP